VYARAPQLLEQLARAQRTQRIVIHTALVRAVLHEGRLHRKQHRLVGVGAGASGGVFDCSGVMDELEVGAILMKIGLVDTFQETMHNVGNNASF
jgi:hypothetical protein